jgi:hypothetical protein
MTSPSVTLRQKKAYGILLCLAVWSAAPRQPALAADPEPAPQALAAVPEETSALALELAREGERHLREDRNKEAAQYLAASYRLQPERTVLSAWATAEASLPDHAGQSDSDRWHHRDGPRHALWICGATTALAVTALSTVAAIAISHYVELNHGGQTADRTAVEQTASWLETTYGLTAATTGLLAATVTLAVLVARRARRTNNLTSVAPHGGQRR